MRRRSANGSPLGAQNRRGHARSPAPLHSLLRRPPRPTPFPSPTLFRSAERTHPIGLLVCPLQQERGAPQIGDRIPARTPEPKRTRPQPRTTPLTPPAPT